MTPTLAVLTARFLARASVDAAPAGEVEPYEVAGGFRAAPADLWREAHAALNVVPSPAPADWAAFTTLDAVGGAVPFAAGLFPQRLRTLADVSGFPHGPAGTVDGFSGLKAWAVKAAKSGDASRSLVAAGVLSTLGDDAGATAALAAAERAGGRTAAWHNQSGACAWAAGRTPEAVESWALAGDHLPARFNRGLAALAAGDKPAAVEHLEAAASGLPETSGWCHLARLYLLMAR